MDKNQEVLYLTNEMCKKICQMKIDTNIENINLDNKNDLKKIMKTKLDLEDYLKEMKDLQKSSKDLEESISDDDFVLKGIVSGNNSIIDNRVSEFENLLNSINSLLKTFKVNKELKNISNK